MKHIRKFNWSDDNLAPDEVIDTLYDQIKRCIDSGIPYDHFYSPKGS